MCFAPAAFHPKSSINGAEDAAVVEYSGDVQRYVFLPMIWNSESGFGTSSGGGVIEGSMFDGYEIQTKDSRRMSTMRTTI